MVVILELDGDEDGPLVSQGYNPYHDHLIQSDYSKLDGQAQERINPNINTFSAALGCYPVVAELATHLDLNDLDHLSGTCRQFRANLLQYRRQLMKRTLRCKHENADLGVRLADRMRESMQAWNYDAASERRTITSGRVSKCARDMVGECRRCGTVVCRNCTIKPPAQRMLQKRYRRLCRACTKAPLRLHTFAPEGLELDDSQPSFTREAFERGPCTCSETIHLCLACGGYMKQDATYLQCWAWRTRYSTHLGGIGTGIGEGNEGVECGKLAHCLAPREVEHEIDCDAEELAELRRMMENSEKQGRRWGGTSYMMQEIEGIGGVVKKKVKKRVTLGAVVKEYEDERENGDYLGREQRAENRSWCSWCMRVIPGKKDLDAPGGKLGRSLTDSSGSSVFQSVSH